MDFPGNSSGLANLGVTMYLFTRSATLVGGPGRTLEYVAQVTEIVNATIDLEVTLWGTLFGRPAGTFSWNTMVDGRAGLGSATAALATNPDYLAALDRGQEFAGVTPAEDELRQLVHPTELPGDGPAVGAFAEAITVTPAAGHIADAMGWGVEISNMAASITGVPVSFWADAYGTFGQVSWLIVYPDAAAVDAAQDKLNASAEYITAVDKSGPLFIGGSGDRALFTRLA
ncbi:MAG: hypothetical protein QNM02_18910 [Acidimicrobiia bacterium]|nr:hypothetical protein [Acidimicrobiia bacterium]